MRDDTSHGKAASRNLRLASAVYVVMLCLLLAAFAMEPGFKLGSALAGMIGFGLWVCLDIRRGTRALAQSDEPDFY